MGYVTNIISGIGLTQNQGIPGDTPICNCFCWENLGTKPWNWMGLPIEQQLWDDDWRKDILWCPCKAIWVLSDESIETVCQAHRKPLQVAVQYERNSYYSALLQQKKGGARPYFQFPPSNLGSNVLCLKKGDQKILCFITTFTIPHTTS